MPGTYDDLWWIVLGALIGWLAFWLIDKFFRRDGEPADVDTVKALESVDTLEAQLKEVSDERDGLRNEAEAQRNEAQRLAGQLEGLRQSTAEQSQQITNLQAALAAAREPARAESAAAAAGVAGVMAAGAAALAAGDDATPPAETPALAARVDRDAAPGPDTLSADAELADAELADAELADDDPLFDFDADTDSAPDAGGKALAADEDDDWFADESDTFTMLDELSENFPELDDASGAPLAAGNGSGRADGGRTTRSVMGRLDRDPIEDDLDEPRGLLGRLPRPGGSDRRPD
ncbi:MAG: hypothetical protein R3E83_15905 [Burkholderiaceae bacterium]